MNPLDTKSWNKRYRGYVVSTEGEPRRGRPPLGRTRMVTVGVRLEPAEREELQELAEQQGDSLCAFLRNLVRRELAEDCSVKVPVCGCGLAH